MAARPMMMTVAVIMIVIMRVADMVMVVIMGMRVNVVLWNGVYLNWMTRVIMPILPMA